MELPTISNYGQGNTQRPNTIRVDIGPMTVWFSYETPVAFNLDHNRNATCRNQWGPTTGKHLNWIDGGGKGAVAARLPKAEFDRALDEACNGGEA